MYEIKIKIKVAQNGAKTVLINENGGTFVIFDNERNEDLINFINKSIE